MHHFTFKREARWLFIGSGVPPAVGILIAIVWPVIKGWWGR